MRVFLCFGIQSQTNYENWNLELRTPTVAILHSLFAQCLMATSAPLTNTKTRDNSQRARDLDEACFPRFFVFSVGTI
jgi:hypothetical protein